MNKKRLWITYNSKAGKTAVCCLYMGFQNSTDSHGQWNDDIFSVVSSEVFDLHTLGYWVSLQGDFNTWVGSDFESGGIQGNDSRINKNGHRFCRLLPEQQSDSPEWSGLRLWRLVHKNLFRFVDKTLS